MSKICWSAALAAILFLPACSGVSDPFGSRSLTGDWCTRDALGPGGVPVEAAAWVGGQLFQQENAVTGNGSVKRPGTTDVFPIRFDGLITNDRLNLAVIPTSAAGPDAPSLELNLEIRGPNDLVGTVSGDAALAGEIELVRLGNRCFAS
jgi:hypothetical protein